MCFTVITVNFNESKYTVNENEGPVQLVLTLSKPSPCCLHILVNVSDMNPISATGE